MTTEDVVAEGGLLARWHRLRAAWSSATSSVDPARRAISQLRRVASGRLGLRCLRDRVRRRRMTGGVRVPTSVLLAVLAAAGSARPGARAGAPVRRHRAARGGAGDVDGAGAGPPPSSPYRPRPPADQPAAGCLVTAAARHGRRPLGPGRPPRPARGPRRLRLVAGSARRRPPPGAPARPRAVYRRRRVLAALSCSTSSSWAASRWSAPGFWIGFAVTGALLGGVRGAPAQPGAVEAAARGARPRRRGAWVGRGGGRRCAASKPAGRAGGQSGGDRRRRPGVEAVRPTAIGPGPRPLPLPAPRSASATGDGWIAGPTRTSRWAGGCPLDLTRPLERSGATGGDHARRGRSYQDPPSGWGDSLGGQVCGLLPARPVKPGGTGRFAGLGAVAQSGSAPRSHRGGRGSNPLSSTQFKGRFP